ncbi:MAG: PorT family protein, partial [Bacteroidales bacterium]|nr:PorT family protein [Bacteroidales bacterium]
DWYLPFFKLATEIKVGVGLLDLLVRDSKSNQDYISSIDRINSYIVGFSFHFE